MRILVISDIHANFTALEAVLADAGDFDAAWCLGDLVGYGPDPNECVSRVRQLPNLKCIIGNHDAAALEQIDTDTFNPEARLAILWTQEILTEASREFLNSLPEQVITAAVTLAHGSPRHPVWEYLLDTRTATINFEYFETPYCFVGHTHLPVMYHLDNKHRSAQLSLPEPNHSLKLTPRAILNPGSAGQPRDSDPRAAYALFEPETNTWDYRRVTYNIPIVQSRMTAVGLPEKHIRRLSAGW
ncbi:MAG TPA: metallophosphoesterase family protein [Anaerolineales bacterium]